MLKLYLKTDKDLITKCVHFYFQFRTKRWDYY